MRFAAILFCALCLIKTVQAQADFKLTQVDSRRQLVVATTKNSIFSVDQEFTAELGGTICNLKVIKTNEQQAYLDPYNCDINLFKVGIKIQPVAVVKNRAAEKPNQQNYQQDVAPPVDFEDKKYFVFISYVPINILNAENSVESKFSSNESSSGLDIGIYLPAKKPGLIIGGGFQSVLFDETTEASTYTDLDSLTIYASGIKFIDKQVGQGAFIRLNLGLRSTTYEDAPNPVTVTEPLVSEEDQVPAYGVGGGFMFGSMKQARFHGQVLYANAVGADIKFSTLHLMGGVAF